MKTFLLILVCLSPFVAGCLSQGAKDGAKKGALYGALGAAVSSVVWGRNDIAGDALRGAAVGATMGGVHGAVNDSKRKKAEGEANEREQLSEENQKLAERNQELELEARLLKKIGPDNTEAVRQLVKCNHEAAVSAAIRATSSENAHFRATGICLQAVAAYDLRDLAKARTFYAKLAEAHPETATADDAELLVVDLATKLEDTREQFGLPRRCQ